MMHITQLSALRAYRTELDRFRSDMAELAHEARVSASDDMYTGQLRLAECYFSETLGVASARLQQFLDQVDRALACDLSRPAFRSGVSPLSSSASTPDVSDLSRKVSAQFGLGQCLECAEKLSSALRKRGIHGQLLQLQTLGGRGFITMRNPGYSLPFSAPENAAIASNGKHFGVQVGDYVYDNIFRDGIHVSRWMGQFECDTGKFECSRHLEF